MTVTKARTAREPEHWVTATVKKIVAMRKPPYIIGSGITTSGPVHLGTACEFLYPHAIYTMLSREYETKFYFISDIMDPLDSIPEPLAQFKQVLEPELGKPLCTTIDPYGCHPSYGDHFVDQARSLMERFDVAPTILKQNELYAQGKYDEFAKIFIRNLSLVRDIVFETSQRTPTEEEKTIWSPILPICTSCGKIATTVVTKQNEGSYSYSCTRDVGWAKGCGHEGSNKISEHKYKLIWRLDWPARQNFLNITIELSGADHFVAGGSWFTAVAIHRKIFRREPPIGFKYGLLLFRGKKLSKSKGFGVDVETLLQLVPAEVVKYYLYRRDAQESKEFDPTGYNLLKIYEDFERASMLDPKTARRADRKEAIAFQLSTKKKNWKAKFLDVLLYYQIWKNWSKVGELLKDEEGTKYLAPFIRHWIGMGYAPEEYTFKFAPKTPPNLPIVQAFANALDPKMEDVDVHNLVFRVAKEQGLSPQELFKNLYIALLGKDSGPRMGKLIKAIGINKVKNTLLSFR